MQIKAQLPATTLAAPKERVPRRAPWRCPAGPLAARAQSSSRRPTRRHRRRAATGARHPRLGPRHRKVLDHGFPGDGEHAFGGVRGEPDSLQCLGGELGGAHGRGRDADQLLEEIVCSRARSRASTSSPSSAVQAVARSVRQPGSRVPRPPCHSMSASRGRPRLAATAGSVRMPPAQRGRSLHRPSAGRRYRSARSGGSAGRRNGTSLGKRLDPSRPRGRRACGAARDGCTSSRPWRYVR